MTTSGDLPPSVQELLDRVAIEDLVRAYASGVDERDAARIVACFTDDVEVILDDGRLQIAGGDAHRYYEDAIAASPFGATSHLTSNVAAVVRGDTAHAETTAVAFLEVGQPPSIVVRGLSYSDDLVRQQGRWLISRRKHRSRWEYTVTAEEPTTVERLVGPTDPGAER